MLHWLDRVPIVWIVKTARSVSKAQRVKRADGAKRAVLRSFTYIDVFYVLFFSVLFSDLFSVLCSLFSVFCSPFAVCCSLLSYVMFGSDSLLSVEFVPVQISSVHFRSVQFRSVQFMSIQISGVRFSSCRSMSVRCSYIRCNKFYVSSVPCGWVLSSSARRSKVKIR